MDIITAKELTSAVDQYDAAMKMWAEDPTSPWKINRVLEVMDENQTFFEMVCKQDIPKDIRKNFKRTVRHIRIQRQMVRLAKWKMGLERQVNRM